MSKLRSPSPFPTRDPAEGSFGARRPSWTPSIPEGGTSNLNDIRSSSTRHRPKQSEENQFLLSEWSTTSNPLKRRRTSFPQALPEEHYQRARRPRVEPEEPSPIQGATTSAGGEAGSPPDGKSLHSSWEINVKDLVGDAVGSMSISPTSRDIVLAARRGLFIIDLDHPLRIPRFLPQGGTWDVADVQWNPHPSSAQYVVSTSSEKLLIWNLRLGGKTSIEHILKSHYRAITDINWHTTECDIVVSTGIDSWVWAWDIREPKRPIFGLSAFKSGGTQVKWNYQDANILASSHSNEVLVWDRRKGSLPVTKIRAHGSKIYGIDWSRTSRNELVTCSLDKSIKTWDITDHVSEYGLCEPKSCIETAYPVWRARNIPFGEGILSLPQRGETTLELYANVDSKHSPKLVETFEGHSDVVKEFVWRKGVQDEFQLITWSKDRTLRFWPIDEETMQKVGYVPQIIRGRSKITRNDMESGLYDTFRDPPDVESVEQTTYSISAPVGNREILGEVLASHRHSAQNVKKSNRYHQNNLLQQPNNTDGKNMNATPTLTRRSIAFVPGRSVGGTMSKGGVGPRNATNVGVDQLAWLASVKVGSKRGSSSGAGSRGEERDSNAPSRLGSKSRTRSETKLSGLANDRSLSHSESGTGSSQRSGSISRSGTIDDKKDKENENQTLQNEITTVLTKLAEKTKITLEKHDLTKKRTCTLGLHGPWGESSSVFMRVTFTFPRDYPNGNYPHGTPSVDLERSPLISMRARAYILKHLRRIRERKRPCLEACLRFLLFAEDNNEHDSDSSSDEGGGKIEKEVTMSLLRHAKNLAEPRSSQGVFGPNGELICFFRAPQRLPHIPQTVLRTNGIAIGPGKGTELGDDPRSETSSLNPDQSHGQSEQQQQPQKASYFKAPALVSDAVRRLGLAAVDRIVPAIDPKRPEVATNILRAMTNLLTASQGQRYNRYKLRPGSHSYSSGKQTDDAKGYNIPGSSTRRSLVFMTNTRNFTGPDKKVASDYVFVMKKEEGGLAAVCEKNAEVARRHGRFDHERVFRTLKSLFTTDDVSEEKDKKSDGSHFISKSLAARVIRRLYSDFAGHKDVQMMAMVAILVLQSEHGTITSPSIVKKREPTPTIPHAHIAGLDYFSLSKTPHPSSPISPAWPPSPIVPLLAPSISSSNSSRGSWSSLFNTGSMRQFMNGVQDTFNQGLSTPSHEVPTPLDIQMSLTRTSEKSTRNGQDSPGTGSGASRKGRLRKDSSLNSPATSTTASKSWNEILGNTSSAKQLSSSYSPTGHKPPLRFTDTASVTHEKKVVIFEAPPKQSSRPLFDGKEIELFKLNVHAYAELLFRWELFHKRLELLKVTDKKGITSTAMIKADLHRIGVQKICSKPSCKMLLPQKGNTCQYCGTTRHIPSCTICRLPVKGLSRTCLICAHVTHISCLRSLKVTVPICPSGCGCFCTGTNSPTTRPPSRGAQFSPGPSPALSLG